MTEEKRHETEISWRRELRQNMLANLESSTPPKDVDMVQKKVHALDAQIDRMEKGAKI